MLLLRIITKTYLIYMEMNLIIYSLIQSSSGFSSSWSSVGDSFILTDLPNTVIYQSQQSVSALDCAARCHPMDGCSGVAYKDNQCHLLSERVMKPIDPVHDGYKIINFKTELICEQMDVYTNCTKSHCYIELTTGPAPCMIIVDKITECDYLFFYGYMEDGIYALTNGSVAFHVFCDMMGGGRTMIQRRVDDAVDFNRNWTDYANGFGDLAGSFWLGLEKIYLLTHFTTMDLQITLETFDNDYAIADYDEFAVEDLSENYTLYVSGYFGDAGDSLYYSNGQPFSTADRDNDMTTDNCASMFSSGWWFNMCFDCNLNGQYRYGYHQEFAQGINWKDYRGYNYSYKKVTMSIKSNI